MSLPYSWGKSTTAATLLRCSSSCISSSSEPHSPFIITPWGSLGAFVLSVFVCLFVSIYLLLRQIGGPSFTGGGPPL